MKGLTAALGQAGPYKSPWPEMSFSSPLTPEATSMRLMSDDGRMGFVLLRFLEEDRQSFAQNNESIKALRQLTAEVQSQHPGTKIGLTGLPIIEYDEMQSSEKSMSVATVVSFLGVLAVMIVAFGGFRHATMAMTALVVGMVWACGYITLADRLREHPQHRLRARSCWGWASTTASITWPATCNSATTPESTSQALVETAAIAGPGILTGAVTSAIAFFAAWLTEFPGVSQLGMIAGGGVLLCWLAEATVLPAMIRLTDADGVRENLPAPLNLRFWLAPMFAYPRLTLLLAGAATAVTVVGMHHLRYDYNLLNLQPVGLECVELEHRAVQPDQPQRVVRAVDGRHAGRSGGPEGSLSAAAVGGAGGGGRHAIACRRGAETRRLSNESTSGWPTCRQQVPEIPVTPHGRTRSNAGRRADDVEVAIRLGAGGRRAATTARHAAADPARRIYPPRPPVPANDGRRPASRGCKCSRRSRRPSPRGWPTCPKAWPRASSAAPAAT